MNSCLFSAYPTNRFDCEIGLAYKHRTPANITRSLRSPRSLRLPRQNKRSIRLLRDC